MKATDTISVNPGKTTLGHVESTNSSILRANIINRETQASHIDLLSLLFPTTSAGINEFKKYALPLRTLFATILIVGGLTLAQTGINPPFAILEIVFGSMLALGFLTRPAMACASVYFAVVTALSIRAGQPDLTALSLIFGCALFFALGSGKYSLDMLIRSMIKRHQRNAAIRRSANALGYKAFHYAKF